MIMETVMEKVERLRNKADLFLKQNQRVFITTYNGDWHSSDILIVGENYLMIYDFEGKTKGEKFRLLWLDIDDIKEHEDYKKEEGE